LGWGFSKQMKKLGFRPSPTHPYSKVLGSNSSKNLIRIQAEKIEACDRWYARIAFVQSWPLHFIPPSAREGLEWMLKSG
jgi:hypothetical protein